MSAPFKPGPVELSIGALSVATGVPIETLRTWERRYGFPTPIARTDGSHRRYAADTVEVVQLIVEALGRGHRPSAVVGRSSVELRKLLRSVAPASPSPSGSEKEVVARWIDVTRDLDAESLANEFELGLAGMPAIDFLERRMGPYLAEVGERWARGDLRVTHEHFASERAREFLSSHWRGLADAARRDGVAVVLATPPGELHVLGLHMAAWVVGLAEARVIFLGADTPISDIAFAAQSHGAAGVVLSVVSGYAGDLPGQVTQLAKLLPARVRVVVGGSGIQAPSRHAKFLNRFADLANWVRRLPATASAT